MVRDRIAAFAAACAASAMAAADAFAAGRGPDEALFRAIYRELVEINTTASAGDTLRAANAMAARLISSGWPRGDVEVLSTGPRKGNLVARLRGNGTKRPILLGAHIDVVEAKREDWSFDPFKLQEADGYFRGRGMVDNKAMAAIFVANLIRYRSEGFKPQRDIILALTTYEEISDRTHHGMRWLLENRRQLIDAELAINEGGGAPTRLSVQLAEKVYRSFSLEVKDPGGHSATPRSDNANYRLALGLVRLSLFEFPARLNPVTSTYFELVARFERPEIIAPLARRPAYNAQIRTTCVATMVQAGHTENALPQSAGATINCRLLPDEQPAAVEATLKQVVADERIAVLPLGNEIESPVSPLSPVVMTAVEAISAEMWPGVPVIRTQYSGYTDSRWLRRAGIPTYGVSGLLSEEGKSGVHGLNEQVGVHELFHPKEFLYRLVRKLAAED